ncbi:MAG: hypothetical protein FI703_08670 [SAR202 cluster bacterium]|nr:hypothetical protein [SAR202 cluster bacterium]
MLRPLDLVLSTFIDGETQGREAVLDVLKRAQAGGMYSRTIEWKKIDADATPMRVEAVQPASAFPAGFTWDLSFNHAEKVTKIQQANVRPTGPAQATPIELTEAMVDALAHALENGTPTLAAYVNEHGQPSMSTRGTPQVFSDNETALWARCRDTGMAKAVKRIRSFPFSTMPIWATPPTVTCSSRDEPAWKKTRRYVIACMRGRQRWSSVQTLSAKELLSSLSWKKYPGFLLRPATTW